MNRTAAPLRVSSLTLPASPKPQGPDASTELQMIDLLRGSAAPSALPLLPHLLRSRGAALAPSRLPGPSAAAGQPLVQPEAGLEDPLGDFGSPCYSGTDDDEVLPAPAVAEALEAVGVAADGLEESPLLQAERIIHQFSLNQEQGEVLQYVASWQMAPGSAASAGASKWQASSAATGNQTPPVCLVHGPFGSGEIGGGVIVARHLGALLHLPHLFVSGCAICRYLPSLCPLPSPPPPLQASPHSW